MPIVIIYILVIFIGKDYFSIKELGVFFFSLGLIWFIINIKKPSLKKLFQPIVLIIVGIISFLQDDFLVLKSFPLIISFLFFLAFVYAQVTKEFFLVDYIAKFKKITQDERVYLQKTHQIWVVVTFINLMLHIYFLFFTTTKQWALYAGVGWYILLGCGIIFQVAFRKFYERKKTY